jgi:type II secretory pathway pseudopilin PulG
MSQASFAKRQREKARQEKNAAKAARRAERQAATDEDPDAPTPPPADQGALLAALADLHARFEDGDIDFDDFTDAKAEITQHLQVE